MSSHYLAIIYKVKGGIYQGIQGSYWSTNSLPSEETLEN